MSTEIVTYAPSVTDGGDFLMTPGGFSHAIGVAERLARSTMIPDNFRGKPEDILIAMNMARRMNEDLFVVLSALHFIHGRPGWSAAFMIARANASGIFRTPLEFDVTGEGREMSVTCSAVLAGTGKPVSASMSMATAVAEGWASKNKRYQTLGAQMLSYRAATMLIRLYAPGLLFGMRTEDENEDIGVPAGRPVDRLVVGPEVEPEKATRRKARAIDAEPIAEHVELVQEMVQGRQTVEVAEAPVVEMVDRELTPEEIDAAKARIKAAKEAAKAQAEAEKAARQATWDPSWKASYKGFCGDVSATGLDPNDLFDFTEQSEKWGKRPSHMTADERREVLAFIRTPEGNQTVLDFVAERAARAELEPTAVSQ